MSGIEPPRTGPRPLACPRCGQTVRSEQDWCLECGAPARTRLAPTPNWRLPIVAVATVVLAAGIALTIAFVALTHDDGTVTAAATSAPVVPSDQTSVSTVPPTPGASTAPGATVPATPTTQPATTPATATAPTTSTSTGAKSTTTPGFTTPASARVPPTSSTTATTTTTAR